MDSKQKFFDSLAITWHENHQFSQEDKAKLERILSPVKFSPQDLILDLGGGTGRLSEFLFQFYKFPLNLFVLDISPEMLREGKKRLRALKVSWVQAEANTLPFKNEIFQHILCFSSFPHFEDKEGVIKEAGRALKPGGDFLIFHLEKREKLNQFHAHQHQLISKDFLPTREEFQDWSKKMNFFLQTLEDSQKYFLAHFIK